MPYKALVAYVWPVYTAYGASVWRQLELRLVDRNKWPKSEHFCWWLLYHSADYLPPIYLILPIVLLTFSINKLILFLVTLFGVFLIFRNTPNRVDLFMPQDALRSHFSVSLPLSFEHIHCGNWLY